MTSTRKAYFVGGGIGSLAGAAFLIRDGGMPGANIRVMEAGRVMGGSLDGAGDAERGYTMRGGRMLTTDNYECTWDLFKSIPSIVQPGRSVFDETLEFNEKHVSNAMARLVDSRRAKVPVASMGFSMHDRMELLKLASADESMLGASCITDHLSPAFFQTEFWSMWVTTFAFQPWHSAVEFRRYLHRFMLEFSRIETLAGVKRTVLNQYDSLVVPLQRWLEAQGVQLINDCTVTDIDARDEYGCFEVFSLTFVGKAADVQVFWGYGLFPDRIGNFVAKAMADCTGAELLQELCGHLRFDLETVATANCIPCRMPYITSMFMPRAPGDRPLPVPEYTANFAFISQFVEIPLDTVFTVEFSVRAAQMAVYQLLGITKPIPQVTRHDRSLETRFEALVKALK